MRREFSYFARIAPIALASSLLLIGLVLYTMRRNADIASQVDPVCRDKRLSSWIEDLDNANPPEIRQLAIEEIQSVGTNALPLLLCYLSKRDNAPITVVRSRWEKWIGKEPSRLPLFWRLKALSAFRVLGPTARPAIPSLKKLLEHNDLAYDAARALGATRVPEALPPLLKLLDALDAKQRAAATAGLGDAGAIARSSVARLISLAQQDNSAQVREEAVEALAKIGPAELVFPILVERFRNDSVSQVRGCAAYSLGFFPEKVDVVEPLLEEAMRNPRQEISIGARIALQNLKTNAASRQSPECP